MGLFAFKYIKEPPGPWEIEVQAPAEWLGRFTSADGIEWWSPVLERSLGEHNQNPGEARILENLRALARKHHVTQMELELELEQYRGLGYHSPYLLSPYEKAAQRLVAEATRATNAALSDWADQVGMTVDAWLDVYEPHIEATSGPGRAITLRVTARLRNEGQPAATSYEPTEETDEP
jgi:hypothetical protein